MNLITSRQNPLVRRARALRQARERRKQGLFLVEGIFHVGEALAAGWQVETLFYAPALLRSAFAKRLIDDFAARGGMVRALDAGVFATLTEREHPQGIAAVVRQRLADWQSLPRQAPQRAVALVQPQDPGNVGTILRTLDAVGGEALFLLDGGVDLFHPTLVRASMGALFWLRVYTATTADFFRAASQMKAWVVGTSAHATTSWRTLTLPLQQPVWLLLGSEQKGLSAQQLAACSAQVALPMRGRVTSLNLAVAAGVLAYGLWG